MTEGERVPAPESARTTGQAPASPGQAAFLSFVLPGLGQIALGSFGRGVLLAGPILVTILIGAFFVLADRADLISGLFDPTVILVLVIIDVLLGLLHLLAIGDAYRLARRRLVELAWSRPGSPRLLGILLVVTLVIHGAIGAIGVQAYDTFNSVFTSPKTGYTIPPPSFGTPAPGATASPSPSPGPAWAADGRLNILLIGGDAGPGRTSLRTDTMIVLSADVASGRVTLFGIPRNLISAPLAPEDAAAFPGGRYPDLLNSLWRYAEEHPGAFKGEDGTRGFRAITGAVQQLVGVPLDGAVVINLNGFVDVVNALGGVWVNVPYNIHDSTYPLEDGSGYIVLNIKAGCHHFMGHLALAFARSRHQDSDYGRMGRQQLVLQDLAEQVDPLSLIFQIPNLLQIAGDNVRTTFQPADMGQLLRFAASVDRASVREVLFVPPTFRELLTNPEIAKIQKIVRTAFVTPAGSPSPSASIAPATSPSPGATPSPGASSTTCGP
jgi:polyisoprenyl-teichoic acid--peptidoglycan teichoic acid transferase